MASNDERLRQVSLARDIVSRPELGSVFGLIIIVLTFMSLTSISGTFSAMWTNPIGIQAWVELAAFVGILAIGAALLMIVGEFDLSMGANIALAGHSFALLLIFGVPVVPAIFITFCELALLGLIIGTIVVRTGLPSFIVTLGFWFASRGLAVFLSQTLVNQSRLSVTEQLKPPAGGGEDPSLIDNIFAFDRAFGLPFDAEVYYFAILVVIMALMLHKTRYGNWIYAAGGDPQAARAVGVPVNRVKISLFMLSACLACLLGILTVMTSGASDPKAGDFRELHAIAAAVIGGCALTGGYGSVVGAVLGAFIFAIASRGINFVPFIDNNLFRVMLGLLVLGAALLNQFLRNRVLKT
ncbi:MAG: ABC transporter permease [Hyphomicrobiales bacterium]|nr:ABC transporter permease [Hyphomicrobiales bacterium]MCY4048407.1 ABC transporter permease [Hyphomicrobiales bacterium]MCY4053623.1 ABC transporter permease [Hyphomicrobiales bacterium]